MHLLLARARARDILINYSRCNLYYLKPNKIHMAESSIKHPKHAAANEGPGTPRSSQKAACRTSSIHEKASVLLKSARLDLKTALEVRTRLPKLESNPEFR